MNRIFVSAVVATAVAALSIMPAATAGLPVAQSGPAVHVPSGASGYITSSANWSGYAAIDAKPFTAVVGKWQVPKETCQGVTSESHVIWVGLDGWDSNTVEQGGTFADCSGTTPFYWAWWEMYPTNLITPVYVVYPGDSIAASVTYANGNYTIAVNDTTSGHQHSFSTVQQCATGLTCARYSAEWIGERPCCQANGDYVPLSEWTTKQGVPQVGLFGCFAAAGGKKLAISHFTNYRISMVASSGHVLAQAGSLGAKGQGFQDTWDAES